MAIRDKRIEQLEAEFTETQQQYTECYDEVISPMLLFIARLTSLLTSVTCMSVWMSCIPCLGLLIIFLLPTMLIFLFQVHLRVLAFARATFTTRDV